MSTTVTDHVARALAGPALLGSYQHQAKGRTCQGAAPVTTALPHCYAVEWARAAERFAHLEALVFDGVGAGHRFTFEELEASSNRLARSLAGMGIGVGDRVATIANNRPELVVLVLTCLKLGVTFVPLATDLRPQDCWGVVARYEPSLIVCDQPQHAPFERPGGGEYRTLLLPPFEAPGNTLKVWMAEGRDEAVPMPDVPADVPSVIFSTSGSTALPKGVMFSHADLACLADVHFGEEEEEERTKHLMWVSMRGKFGGTLMLLRHLLQGAQTLMVDTYPSGPQLWSELIDKHRLNSHLLFGAAMNQTLQELPHRAFESVRNIVHAGSCFAPALVQRSMEQFPNAKFLQVYGMTEVGPIAMLTSECHKRAGEASQGDVLRMSSAGKVVSLASVFIEDLEQPGSGKPPPAGKEGVGQICARSPCVTMMGYYANLEKTAEAMPDGKFVRTGDIGRFDEDGFLHVLGRVKDLIPTHRGFNVAPRDIEEMLYSHPGVGQASVVAVWHPSGAGEAVVAWARAKAGTHLRAEELREHCQQSGLAKWQMPDAIHMSHEALPTTGGKVDAKALRAPAFRRAQLAAELGAAAARSVPAAHGEAGDREALAGEFCGAGSERLCGSSLSAVFGEAPAVAALGVRSGVHRGALLAPLWAMADEEYESFQLQARSLLGNWADGKVA